MAALRRGGRSRRSRGRGLRRPPPAGGRAHVASRPPGHAGPSPGSPRGRARLPWRCAWRAARRRRARPARHRRSASRRPAGPGCRRGTGSARSPGGWAGPPAGAAGCGASAFAGAGRAAAAGARLTLFGSSPSPAISAMSWLTGTSAVPSGTTILARMPSSTASTSMVALSVSISAMTSPDLTVSPSFFSHLARLPFSMVGDRAGIRMLMGMA